jgi:hypothetical protein
MVDEQVKNAVDGQMLIVNRDIEADAEETVRVPLSRACESIITSVPAVLAPSSACLLARTHSPTKELDDMLPARPGMSFQSKTSTRAETRPR